MPVGGGNGGGAVNGVGERVKGEGLHISRLAGRHPRNVRLSTNIMEFGRHCEFNGGTDAEGVMVFPHQLAALKEQLVHRTLKVITKRERERERERERGWGE